MSLASLTSGAPAPEPNSLAGKRDLVMSMVRDMAARARAELAAHGDDAFTRLALEWKIARIHVRRLATRGDQFIAVLTGVCEGRAYPEIAESLAITRREVELTVRSSEELMQARFNT